MQRSGAMVVRSKTWSLRRGHLFGIVVCCVLLQVMVGASAEARTTPSRLPASVTRLLDRYHIDPQSLGVFVQEVRDKQPLLEFNARTPFNPASTIKLLTTFVALDTLGPAYTWKTEAYVDGRMEGERLDGNLVLKGYGDPFLVTQNFWKFVRGLRDRGLREITGDVVGDDSYFDPGPPDPGEFDGRPYQAYNAPPDALLLNFQAIRFNFFPDAQTGRVRVVPEPAPANLKIDNDLKLVRGRCGGYLYRIRMQVLPDPDATAAVRFSGKYPAACGSYAISRVVTHGPPFALGVFKSLWSEMGGRIDGTLRTGTAPPDAKPFFSVESPPLADVIRSINKYSNNVMTRQMLLTLGAVRYGAPGTTEKGEQAIMDWLRRNHLDFRGLVLDNGAGLSRETRISARSLGQLLLRAHADPYMPEFVSSLPIPGVDGTLRHHFRGTPLVGHAHLKTGSLDNVKAIAGYVQARSGRTFVVVSLQNYPGIQWGRGFEIQRALLEWVYRQ